MGVGLKESSSGSKRGRRSAARANSAKKSGIRDVRSLLVEDNKRVQNSASDKVKSGSRKERIKESVEPVSAVDVELEDFCVTEEPVVEEPVVQEPVVQEKAFKQEKSFGLFGKKSESVAKEEKPTAKTPRKQRVEDDGQEHVYTK